MDPSFLDPHSFTGKVSHIQKNACKEKHILNKINIHESIKQVKKITILWVILKVLVFLHQTTFLAFFFAHISQIYVYLYITI